ANTGSMAKVTTPFKMLESVAARVPVIATDIPAQVDMIEDGGYGLLVDGDDPTSLARAVAKLASDDAARSDLVAKAEEYSPKCRWTYAVPQLAAAIEELQASIGDT